MTAIFNFLKPFLIRYLPIIGRYLAAALVGILAAGLNRLNIALDPSTNAELTAGLTAVFIAVAGWAVMQKKGQVNNDLIATAVRQASASGNAVTVKDIKTGETHTIAATPTAVPSDLLPTVPVDPTATPGGV